MPEYQILEIKNGSQLDCLIDKKASYEQLEFGFSPEYLSTLKEQLQFPHALQFFAKMDNETVGYIAASELELFQGYMYVSELFVEPKVSGKGIASALVNKVVDFAKSEGLKGVYTQTENENIPAQKLYEKLAFSRIENPEWEGVTYKIEF
jgi:GNAT superfamily N-acetyltransferase